ncbi:MAG: ATP-binding protein, partial [Bacteroidia bacterium]
LMEVLFFHHLFYTLVTNSTITFDFFNILNIQVDTYIALLPLALINLSIPITLYAICKYSFRGFLSSRRYFLVILIGITIACNLLLTFETSVERYWLVPIGLSVLGIAYFKKEKNIISLGACLLISALFSSFILNAYISKNELQEFDFLSYKLTERQDAVLENEFLSLSKKIKSNEQLKTLSQFVAFNGEKEFLALLNQNYFFGYFDRYNITYSMFDENCTPLLKTADPILQNEGFFEEQIRYQSIPTADSSLYFIDQHKDYARYISKITLGKNLLYILLEPKFFEEIGAFPDLLMDESQQKSNRIKNVSYAVYRSGLNNKMYGDYNYPVHLNDSLKLANNKYQHYMFYPDETSTVVISSRKKGLYYFFTYNSYLFLLFSILAYFGFQGYYYISNRGKINPSLTRRIQTTVVLLLLLSIASVGIISNTLVSDQFHKDNEKRLQEKSYTILSELSSLLQNSDNLNDVPKELIDQAIKQYAYVFNSDISIFTNSGFLYLTSQPRLYELGLAAPHLNAESYQLLKSDIVSSHCSKDFAGNLNYLSYYAPIYNNDKTLLGYLNLPYFGKQSVLTNELSNIISTLINVYVILFIISIVSGLVLSGYITLPLRLLKQKMGLVNLGTKNEAIEWESNDEIGSLVAEYNSMIEKLDNSANMLARSQREMAWREMAKQVAHEIKNPLTPMKLNLQYLQHVLKDNPDDFEERFKKASNSIIEQIDTLANIATEFSNFAKLPTGQLEKIDLAELIRSSIALFEKEQEGKIIVDLHEEKLIVNADKEQMLRVFNNLIKNAIQATSEITSPRIKILSKPSENGFIISVSDNGIGIPDEIKEKIFTPNFTTKSTGSGLGLAMVKNILDTINAVIWFESEPNQGTTFNLQFKTKESS